MKLPLNGIQHMFPGRGRSLVALSFIAILLVSAPIIALTWLFSMPNVGNAVSLVSVPATIALAAAAQGGPLGLKAFRKTF